MGVYIKVFKKDVNKVLLLLVLVPLILFVWFSNYYYTSLQNITAEFNETKAAGNIIQSDSFQKDREVLDKSYSELRNENDALRKENERLKSQLDRKSADFSIIQDRYVDIQSSLINANDDLSRLSAKNKELCQNLKEKGGEC